MSGRYFLWLGSLIGLLSLTTCQPKAIGPSIDDVVGQYDATMEFTGGWEWLEHPVNNFEIARSPKRADEIDVKIEIATDWTEHWEVKYVEGGYLVMDNQIVRTTPTKTTRGDTLFELQNATGTVAGDGSILLKGYRSFKPSFILGTVYCKYSARKKR